MLGIPPIYVGKPTYPDDIQILKNLVRITKEKTENNKIVPDSWGEGETLEMERRERRERRTNNDHRDQPGHWCSAWLTRGGRNCTD